MMQVERRSGARFGQEFRQNVLGNGTWILRSEPACRAVFVAEQLAGELAFEFADGLISAFYDEGALPDAAATLRMVAEDVGVDAEALLAAWSAPDAVLSTRAVFAMWRARGVSTYPAVFVERGDKLERIFEGYVETDVAIDRVEAVL
jgi:putative protein-disulfide isomerase